MNNFFLNIEKTEEKYSKNLNEELKKLFKLKKASFSIPDVYMLSPEVYQKLINTSFLSSRINGLISTIHFENQASLAQASTHIKNEILKTMLPDGFTNDSKNLQKKLGTNMYLDFNNKKVYLKKGDDLAEKIKQSIIDFFEPGMLYYRFKNKIDYQKITPAISVRKEILPDVFGKILTGTKNSANNKYHPHLEKIVKKLNILFPIPHQVTWGIKEGIFYILSIKPHIPTPKTKMQIKRKTILITGKTISNRITTGIAKIIKNFNDLKDIKKENILIAKSLDLLPKNIRQKISGFIIEEDSKIHTGVFDFHHGISGIINAKNATRILKEGKIITINGKKAHVHSGGFF